MSINAWSYSRLSDFELCPRFAFYAHSTESQFKHLRTFGPAAERGTRIHTQGEEYLKGVLSRLPQSYSYVKEPMKALKALEAVAEGKWTFTNKWGVTEWRARNAWLRLAIDARAEDEPGHQRVIDFKTGKIYETHKDQLELYALCTFKMFPDVESVTAEAWYLDLGEIHDMDVDRSEEKALTKKWEKKAGAMLTAKEFPANPCWKCRFCDFAKSKGGPCDKEKR